MVSHLTSLIFAALSLQMLSTDGRKMKTHVFNGDSFASSNYTSLLYAAGTTNYDDAMGLMLLTTTYPQLYGEQFPLLTNDPCYPQKLDWIECSNDPIRRVTALYLGYTKLAATLPDFRSMHALEEIVIDLSNNGLSGPIPEFLGTFPKLTYLNLAYNYFVGLVPASLSAKRNLNLILTGNPGVCSSSISCSPPSNIPKSPPPGGGGGHSYLTILGVTITPTLVIAVAAAIYLQSRSKKKNGEKEASNTDVAIAGAAAFLGGMPP